jgi:P4 family phage/plasmid primase-like protien
MKITRVTNQSNSDLNKNYLCKSISLNDAGEIIKKPNGQLSRGIGETIDIASLTEFHSIISNLNSDQAIMLAIADQQQGSAKYDIVSKRYKANNEHCNAITKSKEYYKFQSDRSIMMLDFDYHPIFEEGGYAIKFKTIRDLLCNLIPEFSNVELLIVPSSSSGIHKIDEPEPAFNGGMHVYFVVDEGTKIPDIGNYIKLKFWENGFGYHKIADNCNLLARHLFDDTIYSAERLIFEAPPILSDNLKQIKYGHYHQEGGILDSSNMKLTDSDKENLKRLINDNKNSCLSEVGAKRQDIGKKVKHELLTQIDDKTDSYVQKLLHQECDYLDENWQLRSFRKGIVTVRDVIERVDDFIEDDFVDPFQTFNSTRFRAKVFKNQNGSIVLNSFRDGKTTYYLKKPIKFYAYTEIGNSERFCDRYVEELCYLADQGQWLKYNGKIWERYYKPTQEAMQLIKDMESEAKVSNNEELLKWQFKSQNSHHINSIINLASSKLSNYSTNFDKNGLLINLQNGVFDLDAFQLRPHSAAEYMSKIANVQYIENSKCPRWLKFVDEFTCGDAELSIYLQKLCGLCLTTDVTTQALHVLHGSGANGKSLFLKIISGILGDYMTLMSSDFLLAKAKDSKLETTNLQGVRLAIINELPENGILSDNRVKELIGNGQIKARGHYQNFSIVNETYKILIASNYKPVVKGQDDGIWRRLRIIECELSLSDNQKDHYLEKALLKEIDGIFIWMLDGLKLFKNEGLDMTSRMYEDVQQFKKSEDQMGRFIDECLYISIDNRISAKLVYDVFCSWQGKNPIAFSEFLKKMEHKGYVNKQRRLPDGGRITGFEGLGINADYLIDDVNQSQIESVLESAVCA